jgi:hypothetical protein
MMIISYRNSKREDSRASVRGVSVLDVGAEATFDELELNVMVEVEVDAVRGVLGVLSRDKSSFFFFFSLLEL